MTGPSRAVLRAPVFADATARPRALALAGVIALGFVPALAALPAQAADIEADTAVLRALDKVSGRVQRMEVPIGREVRFGPLAIIVRACFAAPPEERPEDKAFLDIVELKPEQPAEDVFRGWMFSSSPALSAMEHAVYDIWVIDCYRTAPPAAEAETTGSGETPEAPETGEAPGTPPPTDPAPAAP